MFQMPNINVQIDHMATYAQIILKNGEIYPSELQFTLQMQQYTRQYLQCIITIRIPKSYGQMNESRKYMFGIQQMQEQQTDFIGEDQSFDITWVQKPGIYNFYCVNYPKLRCKIKINKPDDLEEEKESPQRMSNNKIKISELEAVQEEKEEKEDETKDQKKRLKENINKNIQKDVVKGNIAEQNDWFKDESEELSESPFGTPKKAQLSDYDRILSNPNENSETIQNRYLKYFQEEFKLWRNFFEDPPQNNKQIENQNQISSPIKEKPKSQRRKASDDSIKEERKEENWSKRQNFSPTQLFFTGSCGSASYNQTLSEYEKEKSVGSYLYSHQQMHDRNDEQLYDQTRTMKKTNSEYRLAVQDLFEQKQTLPDTQKKRLSAQSPKGIRESSISNLMDWVDCWCQQKQKISIKPKEDLYIVNQWLTHLKNKYKLTKFLYE